MSEDRERSLRIAWLEKQMQKADFDMEAERQRYALLQKQVTRQTWAIVLSGVGIVVGAFAAGAAWWNYFGHHP